MDFSWCLDFRFEAFVEFRTVDDRALMISRTDLLDLVERAHDELEAASLALGHFGLGAHLMSRRRRRGVLHLDAGADGSLARIVVGANCIDSGHFHHADHRGRRHHARERGVEFAREVVRANRDRMSSLAANWNRTHQSPPTSTNPTNRWIISATMASAPTENAIVRHGCIAFR